MRAIPITLLAAAAFAQPGAPPAFEVASIKPAAPMIDGRMRVMMGGDPGRVNYTNVSLKDIIRAAYQVKDHQISGPDWLNSTRFDVTAKLPAGASRDQVPAMLQALLADRFKLALHHEKKEMAAYALVVAKGGPKLKPSENLVDAPAGGPPGPFRGGRMLMQGRGHLAADHVEISGFADILARQLDRPVFDATGLQGPYDFKLDWTPDEMQNAGLGLGPVRPEGEGEARGPAESGAGVTIFAALQEQLGLKLESRKSPIDVLVIDHMEKAPTEN